MSLDIDYFSSQIHITDLQKLNDKELYFVINFLEDVLEEFRIQDGFDEKDIIKACGKAIDLFKDFHFILYNYMSILGENDLPFCDKTNTERLINDIDTIVNNLIRLSSIRASKEKVINLGNNCSRDLQNIYNSINEYINEEYNTWEAERCRQEEESEDS